MKIQTLLISILLSATQLSAQVTQRVIAEHFTNTKCGACASVNPNLKTNFDNNPEVIHISIHPSSPYASCVLNQHNKSENDGRTNYYGIFGSTPKVVVSGVLATSSFSSPTLLSSHSGKSSPLAIVSAIESNGSTIMVTVKITTKATHSLGIEKLAVFLVEDTVFYDAPNGEKIHLNVFRKALTSINGNDFTFSNAIDADTTLTFSSGTHTDWDLNRIRAVVMVQKSSDRSMIQAEESPVTKAGSKLSSKEIAVSNDKLRMYPNPAKTEFYVSGIKGELQQIQVVNLSGQTVLNVEITQGESVNVTTLPAGVYQVQVLSGSTISTGRLIIQ
ncbi:MAG: T9SS type A sorting domain-containing protein [Flavobacteriales bacterium]|nr:T9SS type A sorting domain-containing protein [Flavobacteriales bacterium]